MKKILVLLLLTVSFSSVAMSAVTIRYYNKDSKAHKLNVQMDGNKKEVVFDGSKTSSVTIQGSGRVCIIETACGKVEVKDGATIEIKDGCIKIIS